MKIYSYDLKSGSADQMSTELRYVIATARAAGNELIAIKTDAEKSDKAKLSMIKLLKSIKSEGKIDFFADKEAFEKNSREASYLINKFSGITEFCSSENFSLIIKI